MPGMSMSPNVNAYGEVPAAEQAEELFKQEFSKAAWAVILSKFPDLSPSVVTFKILETDAETGKGVGAFILLYEQKPIYIPVVMVDSKLKPLEMFYYKEMNIFLPLSKTWLEEVSKMSLDEMGRGEDIPDSVPRDVNIRDLVMPPYTQSGRVGLAHALEHGAQALFKEAENQEVEIHPRFLHAIRRAPKVALDGIKVAFQHNPALLQKIAKVYGVKELTAAITEGYQKAHMSSQLQEKVASAREGALEVFTKEASSDRLREVFGPKAGEAFMEILTKGYAVQDTRHVKHAAISVKLETEAKLQAPGPAPGWFKLFFVDGPAGNYLVIPHPKRSEKYVGNGDYYYTGSAYRNFDSFNKEPALVVDVNGKEAWLAKGVLGIPIYEEGDVNQTKLWKMLNAAGKGDTPRPYSYGFFIYAGPQGVQATEPIDVRQVTDTGDGRVRIQSDFGPKFIWDTDPTRHTIDHAMNGEFVFLPKNTKWVEIGKVPEEANKRDFEKMRDVRRLASQHRRETLLSDPKLIFRWMNQILQESGAKKVNVKRAGADLWWIEGDSKPYALDAAIDKVAREYDVTTDAALDVLKEAQHLGVAEAYIVDRASGRKVQESFQKHAQPPGQVGAEIPMPPGPQAGPPPGGMPAPPGDPGMAGMAPPPMPTSPMTPTDLAIAEVVDNLREQNNMQMQQAQDHMMMQQQQMEMEAQNNERLIGVLEGIQQRSQEISAATGGMIPAGAEQAPAQAAQMLAPIPPEEPPPPPQPVMDEAGAEVTPDMVAQQINPAMIEDAEALQNEGVFDTAAIAMLAAAPVLQDIVSSYIPNLEKCLDNV